MAEYSDGTTSARETSPTRWNFRQKHTRQDVLLLVFVLPENRYNRGSYNQYTVMPEIPPIIRRSQPKSVTVQPYTSQSSQADIEEEVKISISLAELAHAVLQLALVQMTPWLKEGV